MEQATQRAVTLTPDQVMGYWGYGQPAALDAQLTKLSTNLPGQGTVQRLTWGKTASPDHPEILTGGLAYQGTSEPDSSTNPDQVQVLLSASGLVKAVGNPQRVDFGEAADAWIGLQSHCLTLGREPFGRLPLYWMRRDQTIWFASQFQLLRPLLKTPEWNGAAIYGYSCFSYVPTPFTPIADIFAVPAASEQTWSVAPDSMQVIGPSDRRSHPWQEAPDQWQDETMAIAALQSLLKAAIDHQIADLTDEPVAVFLSGGLDSSIVAALLAQAGVKVRAYTLDFGDTEMSEAAYAEAVAEFLHIPLVKVDANPRRIRQALVATAQALDLPFGDGVTVPLFLLTQAARQETHVIFNGEGGDQLFAGWTNKPLIAAGIYQTAQPSEEPFIDQYLRTFHRLWGYEKQLFQPQLYDQVRGLKPQDWIRDAVDAIPCPSLLHRLRRASLMLKGAQNIHPRATNLGLAHGMQVRSPFCDRPLADWAFQLAGSLYLQGAHEKYILKRAVDSWLPPEIVWRTKRGMGVPLTSWCLNELWHDLGTWLNPTRLQQEAIWHPQIASQIVSGSLGTIQGRRIGECLWLLLMWQVWSQTILGNSAPAHSFDHPFWLPPPLGHLLLRFCKKLNP